MLPQLFNFPQRNLKYFLQTRSFNRFVCLFPLIYWIIRSNLRFSLFLHYYLLPFSLLIWSARSITQHLHHFFLLINQKNNSIDSLFYSSLIQFYFTLQSIVFCLTFYPRHFVLCHHYFDSPQIQCLFFLSFESFYWIISARNNKFEIIC